MELIPVNAEALKRAMEAVSGPEVATLTLNAYKAIDSAMHYGFQAGDIAGYKRGYQDAEADGKAAYDHGFQAGHSKISEDDNQESYDNGYCDGVEDARVDPEEADDYIAYLCSLEAASYDFDDLEPKENAYHEGANYWYDAHDNTL